MIPKGTTHEFWKSIHAGAIKAGKELGVEIIWKGPLREDDRDAQITEVEGFISRGVSGIVLAPLDDSALVGPVADANAQQDPGRDLRLGPEGRRLRQLRRDRQHQGRAARRRAARAVARRQGQSVLLRYHEGPPAPASASRASSTRSKAHPGIKVVSDNQYGGADVEGAYKKASAAQQPTRSPTAALAHRRHLLRRTNRPRSACCARSRTRLGRQVKFVGFDASANLVGAARRRARRPRGAGPDARWATCGEDDGHAPEGAAGRGADRHRRPPDRRRDNMDKPEMKALLHPDLSQWLK